MAQPQRGRQVRRPEEEAHAPRETAQTIFMKALTERGYTADQAKQIIDIVQRMRSGQNVQLNPVQSNWQTDINSINSAWSRVSPGTRRVSQLTARDATNIFASPLIAGPQRATGPTVRETPRVSPVRTYSYTVTVNGEDYQVQTNTALVSRGYTTVPSSRVGQLRGMLVDNQSAIIGITGPGGALIRPGTPEFTSFTQTYLVAYREMMRNPDSNAIMIARR